MEEKNVEINKKKESTIEEDLKHSKKMKEKNEEKVPASKLDKFLNGTILVLSLIILGIIIFFAIQIVKTKQTDVPQIEKTISEYKNKEEYTYLVNIENTKNKENKNIKITKIGNIIEYQFNKDKEEYAILKKDKEDVIYLVKDSDVKELNDHNSEEYKKYLDEISKDYLNIKKYGINSVIAIKDSNNIILSKKDGTKLQFESSTHMPSVFIHGNEKISFTFNKEKARLILPYLKSQIDANSEKIKQEKENTEKPNEKK